MDDPHAQDHDAARIAYYGPELPRLEAARDQLLDAVERYPRPDEAQDTRPILYCTSRIKSPASMRAKLAGRGLAQDVHTALASVNDAVGVRVICSFVCDVYDVASWLEGQEGFEVIRRKDYLAYPKPNGYRSLHLIVRFTDGPACGLTAEIQLRTIAIDCWAALEHQLKYKRHIAREKTIQNELKRCADEIASVDMSLQTLRDILAGVEDEAGDETP